MVPTPDQLSTTKNHLLLHLTYTYPPHTDLVSNQALWALSLKVLLYSWFSIHSHDCLALELLTSCEKVQ